MTDPNVLADSLSRDLAKNQAAFVQGDELIVILAALRLYGAAVQPLPLPNYSQNRPKVYRADGRIEDFQAP